MLRNTRVLQNLILGLAERRGLHPSERRLERHLVVVGAAGAAWTLTLAWPPESQMQSPLGHPLQTLFARPRPRLPPGPTLIAGWC